MGQRAAIYARVSTSDQSCERQVAELTAFAERGGYDVIGVFKETASGASANRAARSRVLDLAQTRQIDAILVSESALGAFHPGSARYPEQACRLESLGCCHERHDL